MALLDAAGIYVISDLSEPDTSINRDDPAWNLALYSRYTSVIDSLQNYTNVIGFFAGNEVSNSASTTNATAYVKAAVRDMKAYIKNNNYRAMGVGYAADDDATSRATVANYLNCGSSSNSIDFWGYNIYEWCGDSSYTQSGYDQRTAEFANYSVPAFFAEYGCNLPNGAASRPFTEVQALFGANMSGVFSGGIVYEYFEEENDYGLVTVSGTSVSTLSPEFGDLATQISSISTVATGVNSASYTPTNTVARSCPTVGANWQASSNLPPTPNQALCECMVKSLSCVAKSSISTTSYGTLFSEVCGYINGAACAGIDANPANGTYGAYSMCDSMSQLSFAFDAYYKAQGKSASACSFGGNAQTQSASTASSCSTLLAQAASGTGTVTSFPTGTSGSGSGSGSSSGTAAASSSKAAAGNVTPGQAVGTMGFAIVGYVIAAIASGAGMIML